MWALKLQLLVWIGWLNSCVNLTEPWGAQVFGRTLFWVFLDDTNIWLGVLRKADWPLECGCLQLKLKAWIEQKTDPLAVRGDCYCQTAELGCWSFPVARLHWNTALLGSWANGFWTGNRSIAFLGSQAFRFVLELHHQLSCVSSLSIPTEDLGSQPP